MEPRSCHVFFVIYGVLVFPNEKDVINFNKNKKSNINYPYNFNVNDKYNLMIQDLISSCLRKDPSFRLNIHEIIHHEIFTIVNNL